MVLMRPMLATRGTHVPTGGEWTHEVKWDGMRILAETGTGTWPGTATGARRTRLTSRNENDVSVSFPELQGLGVGRDLLLDGEIVAFDPDDAGRPSFARLADRMHVANARRAAALAEAAPVTFLAFDLLGLDGRDVTGEPLERRRELLTSLGLADAHWQVPPAYDDGAMLLEATAAQGLEGVVSKRLSSRYVPGARSRDWLKFPHRRRASWVIGGWRPEVGSEQRLGALLVGEPTADGMLYRGRVGSGIAGRVGPMLRDLLTPLERATSPFADEVPRIDALGTRWVLPRLVVDVESLGFTGQGRLRQPSYRGLRNDLTVGDLKEQS
jgi:bifunctional non-homologous end joining protein LigD